MHAYCTEEVTRSDGREGTNRGGNGVGNGDESGVGGGNGNYGDEDGAGTGVEARE